MIQGPASAAPPTMDRVLLVCRNAARRTMLERVVPVSEVQPSALEAVLAVTRRGAGAVIVNLEDVAGAEHDFLAALSRSQPLTRIFAVVGPEEEPLARRLVGDGMADYFVVPGDVHRLPLALAPASTSAGKAEPSQSDTHTRLGQTAGALAGLALSDPPTVLREGGVLVLKALEAARGCVFARASGRLELVGSVAEGAAPAFEMERAVAERAASAGEPILVEMQEAGEPRATGGGILCLPIRESGETFGVICLSGKKGAAMNAQDRLLAEPLVRSLARLCRATSQRQAFARLAQLDPATGLLQGEAFKTALGRLLTRATPLAANVALVLLQPQTGGAAASPEALGEVGRALAARLTEGCIGGRLGPDRFAIAWARRRETGDGPQDARLTFMAQAGSLADLGLFGLSSAQLRLSLAVFPEDGRDSAAIVAAAEQGLHSD